MSSRHHNILLVGTYSSRNKGDAAMQVSAARALGGALQDPRIVISSPFPKLDRDFYADATVTGSSRRRLIWGTLLLLRALAWASCKRRLGVELPVLLDDELRQMAEADLVVDLSGDMLTEDYGVHVAYSHYLPILTSMALGKKVALCAQSIGPFRWTRALARRILNGADLVTARDRITWDYLREMGVTNPALRLTADLAFLLEPVPGERVDEILSREGVSPGRRPLLGVSLSGLIQAKYEARNPGAKRVPFVRGMASVLDRVASELDCDVLFVAHVTGPSRSKDDRLVARRVAEVMQRKSWVLQADYKPEELKGVIARTSLFFGARMHANIAALSSGVPTVAIAYSHKTQGIMDSLGQQARVMDIRRDDLEAGAALLRSTWQQRERVGAELRENVEPLRALSRENIKLLLDVLQRN